MIIKVLSQIGKCGVEFYSIQEVYQETVVKGMERGASDIQDIFDVFKHERIQIVPTVAHPPKGGISATDSRVINTAKHIGATIVSNDLKLGKKANNDAGVFVIGSPDILCLLYNNKAYSLNEYHFTIKELVRFNRISSILAETYLKE